MHETVVVPIGNVEPDGGVQTVVTGPTASVAVVVKLTTAPVFDVAGTVILAGTVSVGGVVSTTCTLNELVA